MGITNRIDAKMRQFEALIEDDDVRRGIQLMLDENRKRMAERIHNMIDMGGDVEVTEQMWGVTENAIQTAQYVKGWNDAIEDAKLNLPDKL